jgi:AcrR family transcriptional regulator
MITSRSKGGTVQKVERKRSYKARNPDETRARILSAAIDEFTDQGFLGARVERIANRSDVTLRMIYHYFKSKASLYAIVLRHVYGEAAAAEQAFDPGEISPEEGMRRLIQFAFDHFAANPELIKLDLGENLLKGAYLRHAGIEPLADMPLFDRMKALLAAGQKNGAFRSDVEATQLWVMISSLCRCYLSQRYTLSRKLGTDVSDPTFVENWRAQVEMAVLAALKA